MNSRIADTPELTEEQRTQLRESMAIEPPTKLPDGTKVYHHATEEEPLFDDGVASVRGRTGSKG